MEFSGCVGTKQKVNGSYWPDTSKRYQSYRNLTSRCPNFEHTFMPKSFRGAKVTHTRPLSPLRTKVLNVHEMFIAGVKWYLCDIKIKNGSLPIVLTAMDQKLQKT